VTRSQKVVFVGLGLVLLLFVLLVVWGQTRPVCKGGDKECAKGYEPGAGIKGLKALFGGAGARIELAQKSYALAPGGSMSLTVPDAKTEMRTLKLRMDSGVRADLTLVNLDGAPKTPDLAKQHETLPIDSDAKGVTDPRSLSFAVTKGGAKLTIGCGSAAACKIVVD
jgi:hypothetical protein